MSSIASRRSLTLINAIGYTPFLYRFSRTSTCTKLVYLIIPPCSMMLSAYFATSLLECPFTTISAAIPLQWYEFGAPFTLLFQLGVRYPLLMMTGALKWFLIVSKISSSLGAHKNSFVLFLHLNSSALKCCVNRSLFVWFKISVLIFYYLLFFLYHTRLDKSRVFEKNF